MIHPTAIVSPAAAIGEQVEIGPYAIVDEHVALGDGCRIGPHVHLTGHSRIGPGTVIHTGAVIGGEPQDSHFDGGITYAEIGRDCVLREYVTVNRGTDPGSKTVIGDSVMLMAFAHVGHNCGIGNNVVIANGSLLGGHVQVGESAFISALVAAHQFVRIGALAMVGGLNRIRQDIPPYCMLQMEHIQGPNTVGLRRAGIAPDIRKAIRAAIKLYFFAGLNRLSALAQIRQQYGGVEEVADFVNFVESTERGIVSGTGAK